MEKGFTLLELIVVLAILALATALIAPMLGGGKDKADFKMAVRDIAASLRETRSIAMTSDRSQALVIDVDRGLFRAAGSGRAHAVAPSIRLLLLTVAQERVERGIGNIRFFPDGSSTGGRLTLTQGNRRSDVLVDWLSGRISIGEAAPAQ
jgi:general secretion pathway protein H